MILNFKHKGLRRFFEDDEYKGIRADQIERLQNILAVMNRARSLEDLKLPGFRLHELKGDRKGQFSITVSANWRLTFRMQGGHIADVNLEDYH